MCERVHKHSVLEQEIRRRCGKIHKCCINVVLSSSFSCVGEIEPTIRAADNALPTANAGENKKFFKAASVKYVVPRAAYGPHLGANEVVHANCAGI